MEAIRSRISVDVDNDALALECRYRVKESVDRPVAGSDLAYRQVDLVRLELETLVRDRRAGRLWRRSNTGSGFKEWVRTG